MTSLSASRLRSGFSLAALVIVLDQITKWVILAHVMNPPRMIEVLPVFNLVLVRNHGISFGMMAGGSDISRWILVALALAVSGGLVVWLFRAKSRMETLVLGAIIGGALGNVIDRVRLGSVTDFLDFHIGSMHWPAFNLADSCITLGVLVLLATELWPKKMEQGK